MPTANKANVIEQTKEKYQKASGVLFTEYRGLKVHQLQALRKELKAKGGEFHVVKNTLFRLAAGEDAQNVPEAMTSGPTAIAFIYGNESEVAKALMDFVKSSKTLVVKGAYLAGKVMDDKQVDALAKLPPRDVLISQLIGTIVAPLTNLVGVIEALYADPIRVIGAVADKVSEGAAPLAPAPEASQPVEAAPESGTPVPEAPESGTPVPEASEPGGSDSIESVETAANDSEPAAEAQEQAEMPAVPEPEAPTTEGEAGA